MYDDDDPVVDEFPVYLCRELEDKLYIFQYPVLPATVASCSIDIVKSQIKPENQEVILEVGLDSSSPNYDRSHGEQIALSIDKDKNISTFPLKYVDRIRLESKRVEWDQGNYAIGTMLHGALVLSAVRGAVSLTPNLSHLVDSSSEETTGPSDEEEAKMVRVQFSKVESDKSKKLREQSYSYFCQRVAEEPWCQTEYHGPSTPSAQVERQKMGLSLREGKLSLSSGDYIDKLAKKKQTCEPPLADRVSQLLARVRGVRTSVAAETLGVPEEQILPCLRASGVLVQGVWVLRSDLRFVGGVQAVPQEQLMKARDYVLLQFWEGKSIERSRLNELVRLPPETLHEIISEVGKITSNKTWVFTHPKDHSFIARYPEIVEQEGLLWEARSHQLLEAPRRRRKDSARHQEDSDNTKRGRKKSESDVKPDIATLCGLKS